MQVYGYGHWYLVFLNVVLFGLFALTIPFRRKWGQRSARVYLAFVIALYTEMYGFPLTIYILAWLIGYRNPLTHMSGHILADVVGEDVFFLFIHPLSSVMMFLGGILVIAGWRKIYGAEDHLVTNGIYRLVRHPQYLGFLLLTLGMLVQWVTIPAALMYPILAALYYRLAREEEKEMEERFGKEYVQYKHTTPMFVPIPRTIERSKW